MSDGIHGHGASLKVCDTTAFTTVTTVGNITSIGGPNQARDTIEKSSMDSTNKWREFIGGMIDAGEMSADINYDGSSGGDANLLDALKTNGTQYWKITFNDHTTEASKSNFYCKGFITGLGHAIPFDDKITQSVTIKLSGTPVYTDLA